MHVRSRTDLNCGKWLVGEPITLRVTKCVPGRVWLGQIRPGRLQRMVSAQPTPREHGCLDMGRSGSPGVGSVLWSVKIPCRSTWH